MNHKIIVAIIAVGVLAATVTAVAAFRPQSRPNIVLFLADDLDVNTMNRMLQLGWMPSLQKYIISDGTTFENMYTTTPLCCPSRATLLTGEYTHNHNVTQNTGEWGGADRLNENETIAVWLQQAGYRTGYIGKYLNGYGSETTREHVPVGWNDWEATVAQFAYRMYDYKVNHNGKIESVSHNWYQTDNLATRAQYFIQDSDTWENDDKPFFLHISVLAPHSEVNVNKCEINNKIDDEGHDSLALIRPSLEYAGTASNLTLPESPGFDEDDVSDKNMPISAMTKFTPENIDCLQTFYRERMEAVRSVDDLIGTVVNALDKAGELDNTILIFTSDNGFMLGEHRYVGKFWAFEEALRVPLYIHVPGGNAHVRSDLVLMNDMGPTILDLAGVNHPSDGRPMLQSVNRTSFLVEGYYNDRPTPAFTAVHTAHDMYLVRHDGAKPEYYDLTSDPYELQNAYQDPGYSSRIEYLKQALHDLETCKIQECWDAENRYG